MKILAGMTANRNQITALGDFKKQLNKLVTLGMGKLKSYKNRKWGDSSVVQFNFVDDYESDRVSLASDGNGDIILLIQLEADSRGLHVFSRVRDNSYGKYMLDKEVGVIPWDDVQDLAGTLLAVLGDKQKWARTPNMRELQDSVSDLSRMATSYSYIKARKLNAKADRVWCDITFVTIPSSFTGNEVTLLRNKGKTKSLKNEKLTPELIANLVGYREWLMSDEYDNLEELVEDVIKIADGKSKDDEADTFCYVPGSDDTVFIVVDNILPR